LAFVLILPAAHLSWKYLERPFLRLKRHFYS
jgi:peptidoglycan/LPS O-acetylase OafA/YrhL